MKTGCSQNRGKKNRIAAHIVPFYTYPVNIVKRAVQLVTRALTSLRGASKCLDIFSDVCPTAVPSHTAIQNWVLQYGLSELMRPVEQRGDWIFVLDHTIEFGPQKCLVILGITQEELLKTNEPVTHQQLRTLLIEISATTNSERVRKRLEELVAKSGIPVQIVSDHGSDLKKGIQDLCGKYPSIRYTYDITHKCGLLLKQALDHDILWRRFLEHYSYAKRKCVHSRFAFLAPMRLQDKSRWMNLDICVSWATKILEFKENMPDKIRALHLDRNGFAKSFQEIFGWVDGFSERIQRWNSILDVISVARDEVKSNGLRTDTAHRFHQKIQELQGDTYQSPPVRKLINDLEAFVGRQTKTISESQKFLGTSDIIESVFAKYKCFSARTPMKGVGKTVLTIPAFLSNITSEKVADALRNSPNKNVTRWLNANIGRSVFAQRAKAFAN